MQQHMQQQQQQLRRRQRRQQQLPQQPNADGDDDADDDEAEAYWAHAHGGDESSMHGGTAAGPMNGQQQQYQPQPQREAGGAGAPETRLCERLTLESADHRRSVWSAGPAECPGTPHPTARRLHG